MMNSNVSDYHNIHSFVGGAKIGESVKFRGEMLHPDLEGMSWFNLFMFGISGRKFTSTEIDLLQAIWVCTSYPDPRIWNNRISSLVGSYRGTAALAASSALAVSEAEIFGGGINIRVANFLKTANKIDNLEVFVMTSLQQDRSIAGYGRPLASKDERIESIFRTMDRLGIVKGSHITLAYEVEKILLKNRTRLHINYAAVAAAICLDLGLSPEEFYLYCIPSFFAGFLPCYLDAKNQKPSTMFYPSCEDMNYLDKSIRAW